MMASATFVDAVGSRSKIELVDEVFNVELKTAVMHLAVRAQLAAARAGTHSTKTRAEVRGGGKKPWRQKGTGRARHGSIREPQWVGGGVAHGPKPRDHSFRLNKKTRALALRSALSDRAREGALLVVDVPEFERPETKRAVELLDRWQASGRILLIAGGDLADDGAFYKSFRNLPHVLLKRRPATYEVLAADTVIFTKEALDAFVGKGAAPAAGPPASGADAGGGEEIS